VPTRPGTHSGNTAACACRRHARLRRLELRGCRALTAAGLAAALVPQAASLEHLALEECFSAGAGATATGAAGGAAAGELGPLGALLPGCTTLRSLRRAPAKRGACAHGAEVGLRGVRELHSDEKYMLLAAACHCSHWR